MATPIENNTEGLQEILQMVNELPAAVNPDDFVLKEDLPAEVITIVQEELETNNVPSKSRITVTLTASAWSNLSQTVTASGVTSDCDVVVSPASSSHDNYSESGVRCTGQGNNQLTFGCTEKPSSNLSVNVMILK